MKNNPEARSAVEQLLSQIFRNGPTQTPDEATPDAEDPRITRSYFVSYVTHAKGEAPSFANMVIGTDKPLTGDGFGALRERIADEEGVAPEDVFVISVNLL